MSGQCSAHRGSDRPPPSPSASRLPSSSLTPGLMHAPACVAASAGDLVASTFSQEPLCAISGGKPVLSLAAVVPSSPPSDGSATTSSPLDNFPTTFKRGRNDEGSRRSRRDVLLLVRPDLDYGKFHRPTTPSNRFPACVHRHGHPKGSVPATNGP